MPEPYVFFASMGILFSWGGAGIKKTQRKVFEAGKDPGTCNKVVSRHLRAGEFQPDVIICRGIGW